MDKLDPVASRTVRANVPEWNGNEAQIEDLKFLRWMEKVAPETMKTWIRTYKDSMGEF